MTKVISRLSKILWTASLFASLAACGGGGKEAPTVTGITVEPAAVEATVASSVTSPFKVFLKYDDGSKKELSAAEQAKVVWQPAGANTTVSNLVKVANGKLSVDDPDTVLDAGDGLPSSNYVIKASYSLKADRVPLTGIVTVTVKDPISSLELKSLAGGVQLPYDSSTAPGAAYKVDIVTGDSIAFGLDAKLADGVHREVNSDNFKLTTLARDGSSKPVVLIDQDNASVQALPLATGVTSRSALVTANYRGKQTTIEVVVHAEGWVRDLTELKLSVFTDLERTKPLLTTPAVKIGEHLYLKAIGVATVLGRPAEFDITNDVKWVSDKLAVAQVGLDGTVTGMGEGFGANAATITATSGTLQAAVKVSVTKRAFNPEVVKIIRIKPTDGVITKDTFVDLVAIGADKNNNQIELQSGDVVWSANNTKVEISEGGRALGVVAGDVQITASYGALAPFTAPFVVKKVVTDPTVASISVSPAKLTMAPLDTAKVVVTAKYTDGTSKQLTDGVIWTADTLASVEVDAVANSYVITSRDAEGATKLKAKYGALEASMDLTITNRKLVSVDVQADSTVLTVGGETFAHAYAKYDDGKTVDVTSQVTWSTIGDVATVGNDAATKGLVKAKNKGSANIVAKFNAKEGFVTIKVVVRDFLTVHYIRDDNNYTNWTLHVWGAAFGAIKPNTFNGTGIAPTSVSATEAKFDVKSGMRADIGAIDFKKELCVLVHKSQDKAGDPDRCFVPADYNLEVWIKHGDETVYSSNPLGSQGNGSGAYWIDQTTIAVKSNAVNATYTLYFDSKLAKVGDATTLNVNTDGVSGGESVELTENGSYTPSPTDARFAHLKGYTELSVPEEVYSQLAKVIRGPVFVAEDTATEKSVHRVQLQGVIDDQFAATTAALGPIFESGALKGVAVWAPTAFDVRFVSFADSAGTTPTTKALTLNQRVWELVSPDTSLKNKFYAFDVDVYDAALGKVVTNRVVDPYATSVSANGKYGQLIDLDDTATMPDDWKTVESGWTAAPAKPTKPADYSFYELHVRDFSVFDGTVKDAAVGKFTAFADATTDGMKHLDLLSKSGLTHVQLMPVFDFAWVPELEADQQNASNTFAVGGTPSASTMPRDAIEVVKDKDAYNWGYYPVNAMVPEGSYSSDPNDGATRVKEFRQLVAGLAKLKLRVSMDTVLSHTVSANGKYALLNKIVPGYYYRTDDRGVILTSACVDCSDLASENEMAGRYVVDTVKRWHEAYKVQAFRLDRMGLLPYAVVNEIKKTVGNEVYVYGEGWDAGSLFARAPKLTASQDNAANLLPGVGLFNDRFRDAVRGGTTAASGFTDQGFASGQWVYPANDDGKSRDTLMSQTDRVRFGLVGNLVDYKYTQVGNKDVLSAGYAINPQQTVNYVTSHDHNTMWDSIAAKAPTTLDDNERKYMQWMAISLTALGQGVPFFEGGMDLLRSKSGDGNSHNSGDWFNRIEFNAADWDSYGNLFGMGLRPAWSKSFGDDAFWTTRLTTANIRADKKYVKETQEFMRAMLAIRAKYGILRMTKVSDIKSRMVFKEADKFAADTNKGAGVIVVKLTNQSTGTNALTAIDGTAYDYLLVVFNVRKDPVSFDWGDNVKLVGELSGLSFDTRVKNSKWANSKVTVEALSPAVFSFKN